MPESTSAHASEDVFAAYLDASGLLYERNYVVDPGDVDFRVTYNGQSVLCEVKAVIKGGEEPFQPVSAKYRIREDIKKLVQKFSKAPEEPLVLVTMNYSSEMFTAYSVQEAMLGDVIVELGISIVDENAITTASDLMHNRKGNASLQPAKNTRISGLLVIDLYSKDHCYIANPHTRVPVPPGFFPVAAEFTASSQSLSQLKGSDDVFFLPARK